MRTRIAYRLRPAGRVVGVLRPAADAEATMPWGMVVRAQAVDGTCRIGLQLPVRPNGRVGWVDERYVHLAWSPWRIEVSRAARSARLLYEGRAVRRFSVDIGTSATPTPSGLFAVLRVMPSSDDSPYGAWVLALTAESDHVFRFAGGPGRIGLHGRGGASLRQPLGRALSSRLRALHEHRDPLHRVPCRAVEPARDRGAHPLARATGSGSCAAS